MQKYLVTAVMLCGLSSMMVACSSHYQVTDPASGRTYYTKKVHEAGKTGTVKFKDAKTGRDVTLQSSEVRQISSDEFDEAVKPQPVSQK